MGAGASVEGLADCLQSDSEEKIDELLRDASNRSLDERIKLFHVASAVSKHLEAYQTPKMEENIEANSARRQDADRIFAQGVLLEKQFGCNPQRLWKHIDTENLLTRLQSG